VVRRVLGCSGAVSAHRRPARRRRFRATASASNGYREGMAEPLIPTYVEMLLPTLQAIDELGGSGTIDEIDSTVVKLMGLTDDQLAVEFPADAPSKGSKVIYRLGWSRSYLKKLGLVDNSVRGVWALEPAARRYLEAPPADAIQALRDADARLRRELHNRQVPGLDQQANAIVRPESGDEGLREEPTNVPTDWRTALTDRLLNLAPAAFERLAQHLLREAGFKNVEVLGRSGDGGLDGVGVYRLSLVSFPIYFQCKRYRGSVGPDSVRDFRGAMAGRGEKGLLVTTGTFSAAAKQEASRDGAPAVELVDGNDLCDLLKGFGVGVTVKTRQVEDVEIEESFFAAL
jgi:restriction system protein